ncbi:transposase [Nitrosomonas communis]|nr:transposase [Nitrosomonas communis]
MSIDTPTLQIARQVVMKHKLMGHEIRAFVLDDSIKARRSKKMPGISSHFDHLTERVVKGQQVLTLGYATEEVFLPLDNELYISHKNVAELKQPFRNGRSHVVKRYRDAVLLSKPEIAAKMVRRALASGFSAEHLLAEAWFGNKTTLRLTQTTDLTAIVRMNIAIVITVMAYDAPLWQMPRRAVQSSCSQAMSKHSRSTLSLQNAGY